MNKTAEVFFRAGLVVVAADGKTTAGVLLTVRPVIVLDDNCSDQLLGDAVALALSAFRSSVPHPSWEETEARRRRGGVGPVYAAVGAKSDSEFARGARFMSIEVEKTRIVIAPMRNDGRGFVQTSHRQTRVLDPCSSAEVIGRALREALTLTE
jgi:hypothetical protein